MSVVIFPFQPLSIDFGVFYEVQRINNAFEDFCVKLIGRDSPIKTFYSLERFCEVNTRDKVVKSVMFISEEKCCIILHYFINDYVRKIPSFGNSLIGGNMQYKGYSIFLTDNKNLMDIAIYYLSPYVKRCMSKDFNVTKGEDSRLNRINDFMNKHLPTISFINPYSIFTNYRIRSYKRIFIPKQKKVKETEMKELENYLFDALDFFKEEKIIMDEEFKIRELCIADKNNSDDFVWYREDFDSHFYENELRIDIITLNN